MNFKLIKVYSETKEFIFCACCDGISIETFEWYRTEGAGDPYDHQKYLDCCKDKMGTVVDWEDGTRLLKITNKLL